MYNEDIIKEFISKISITEDNVNDNSDILENAIKYIRDAFGIFSVAIRVKEDNDFPYYSTLGFSEEFIKIENHLCCKDSNTLECVCGAILDKKVASREWFTNKGSFWTNSVSDLLTTIENDNTSILGIETKMRGSCAKMGYQSMAIIPIPDGNRNIGLLQLNDFNKNKFTTDKIETLEIMAESLGCILGLYEDRRSSKKNRKETARQNLKKFLIEFQSTIKDIRVKNENKENKESKESL